MVHMSLYSTCIKKTQFPPFVSCAILRNDQIVGSAFLQPTTNGNLEASVATVLYLKKDETVSLGSCSNIDGAYDLTSFMGFLLTAD